VSQAARRVPVAAAEVAAGHAGVVAAAAPQVWAAAAAGVAAAGVVAQQDAAAVLRPAGAPVGRAQPREALPSAVAWAFHRDRLRRRLAP
jgi:hypothetical protein